ncbi:hypothetical protein COLO4_10630 [Corchorus olitorius]|uniref:DUF4283 domain-containing protein n=1 Tax=Corchorus olitorius TaxID=93759 RepID=A0A1R3K7N1_9ROSI|nr:hypothetical protein COLO4_10630 [Corchorus olitorius]
MKIEAKFRRKKVYRRFIPYPIKKPSNKPLILQPLQVSFNQFLLNLSQIKMNQQPDINFRRECSWTDSDPATEESEDDLDSGILTIHPPPLPIRHTRLSHRITASREEMSSRREEANKCIIGFLIDIRRFSTHVVQEWLNRALEPTGEATVIGREKDRYLIYLENEVDRGVALSQTPWSFQGAMFATMRWSPNTPLREARLPGVELWMQLWGLPFEYQYPQMAERMARAAGEVVQVDWRPTRTRNIRFMRVRVLVNHNLPLAPGCTLECDDGTTRWIDFSYERVTKLCLSCGMIGHTHRFCSWTRAEIYRMINTRLSEVSHRYGYPVDHDPQNYMFSNKMRAFYHRASRRTTRLVIDNRRNIEANMQREDNLIEQGPILEDHNEAGPSGASPTGTEYEERNHQNENGPSGESQNLLESSAADRHDMAIQPNPQIQVGINLNQAQSTTQEDVDEDEMQRETIRGNQAQGQEEVQAQLQSLDLRSERNDNTVSSSYPIQDTRLTNEMEEESERTEIIQFSEQLETSQASATVEDSIAETYASLQNLSVEAFDYTEPLQITPLQIIPFDLHSDLFNYQHQPREPILDPMTEFDNSVARLEQLEDRQALGFQNLADINDMRYSLAREHARFEHVCDEMVRQSEEMVEDLQNRHRNNPNIQPEDNRARWIGIPEGGAVYTNAKMVIQGIQFELEIMMEEGQLSNIGGSLSRFNLIPDIGRQSPLTQEENGLEQDTGQPTQQTGITLGSGEPVNPRSPSFICTVNEEDLVSAFLRDTPSPETEPPTETDEKGPEENVGGEKKLKRKRDETESDSDDETELENLNFMQRATSRRRIMEGGDSSLQIPIAEGSRQAAPIQPPNQP